MTPLLTRIGRAWKIAWQDSRLNYVVRDGNLCHYFCLEYDDCVLLFWSFFFALFSFFIIFSSPPYPSILLVCFVHAAVICCSSARACSSCILFIFLRRSYSVNCSGFFRPRLFLFLLPCLACFVASVFVPGTLAPHLLTLIHLRFFGLSLSQSLTA